MCEIEGNGKAIPHARSHPSACSARRRNGLNNSTANNHAKQTLRTCNELTRWGCRNRAAAALSNQARRRAHRHALLRGGWSRTSSHSPTPWRWPRPKRRAANRRRVKRTLSPCGRISFNERAGSRRYSEATAAARDTRQQTAGFVEHGQWRYLGGRHTRFQPRSRSTPTRAPGRKHIAPSNRSTRLYL